MRAEIAIPVLIFVAVLLTATALYLYLTTRHTHRKQVSRRLITSDVPVAERDELAKIRQHRSLTTEGHYAIPLIALNRLILQSGVTFGLQGIFFAMAFLVVGFFIAAMLSGTDWILASGIAVFTGIGLPILFLKSRRNARLRKFEEQLPDAVDVFVRGLKAGHAVPVAITTVGRQMPDPVGTEFAITASELTYGQDLETAMINLRSRVGQADLSLVVVAVSIQATLGGNLAEILSNISRVIRGRFKLRRKAKALSAEGRYSAIFLSILPLALFGVLWVVAPTFYGQIWDEPVTKPVLGGALCWMMIGDFMMYRMVRSTI
jgi:tight adherence protein B